MFKYAVSSNYDFDTSSIFGRCLLNEYEEVI